LKQKETILKLGNPLKSKSKFTKSKIGLDASTSDIPTLPVFSLQILIGGDFRIIDGEKIRPRVGRPPVGSV
jgi:hypothetical protein